MPTDFSALKKTRTKNFEKLREEASKINQGNNNQDDRYWTPTRDKAGNGSAVIRFLPAPSNEDIPYVKLWSHAFQGTGGWYIEKSLTTLGKDDPASAHNSKLWDSGIEKNKEIAKKQKRKLKYISNIYVVSDPGNPDNNGKVFLYAYGKKIFDILNEAMNPSFEDIEPFNPYDLWGGANLKLRMTMKDGWPNYERTSFDDCGPLFDDDDKLEEVWNSEYSLQAEVAEDKFKSYDELQKRLTKVLGLNNKSSKPAASNKSLEEELDDEIPFQKEKESASMPEEDSVPFDVDEGEDDDDDMAYFRNLTKSD